MTRGSVRLVRIWSGQESCAPSGASAVETERASAPSNVARHQLGIGPDTHIPQLRNVSPVYEGELTILNLELAVAEHIRNVSGWRRSLFEADREGGP